MYSRLKHSIGADLSFFMLYFQAANIARFGDMVYNVLPKWPFISVMQSHFENQII